MDTNATPEAAYEALEKYGVDLEQGGLAVRHENPQPEASVVAV